MSKKTLAEQLAEEQANNAALRDDLAKMSERAVCHRLDAERERKRADEAEAQLRSANAAIESLRQEVSFLRGGLKMLERQGLVPADPAEVEPTRQFPMDVFARR